MLGLAAGRGSGDSPNVLGTLAFCQVAAPVPGANRAVFAAAQQVNVTDAGKLADIVRIVYDRARLTGDLDAILLESLFTLAR